MFLAIAIGLGLIYSWFALNEIQQWMQRCILGPSPQYSEAEELAAFKALFPEPSAVSAEK